MLLSTIMNIAAPMHIDIHRVHWSIIADPLAAQVVASSELSSYLLFCCHSRHASSNFFQKNQEKAISHI